MREKGSYRQTAVQVGIAALLHAAVLVEGSEDVPGPFPEVLLARHPPQHKQALHRLRPQQVVRVLPQCPKFINILYQRQHGM